MNLYLRLIRVVVLCALAARRGVLESFALGFRVWPTDLDLNLHMNNGRYLTLMDLGRMQLLVTPRLAWPLLKRRCMPVVAAISIQYRRPLSPFQRFTLHTRILGWDDKWVFMEQRFETARGTAAVAVVKGAILEGRRTMPTQALMDLAGITGESPPLPPEIQAWADSHGRGKTQADAA